MSRVRARATTLAMLAAVASALGCAGGGLRLAPIASSRCVAKGVRVDGPPPPARAETVPPSPRADAVWVDGAWSWSNGRWVFREGAWVVVPPGVALRRFALVRGADADLSFTPAAWVDAACAPVAAPTPIAPR